MKISIAVMLGSMKWEAFWGNVNAKYALIQISGTILTVGIELSVKV